MKPTTTDCRNIARDGGGLILDSKNFTVTDMRNIACDAASSGARIVIKNPGRLTVTDIRNISRDGKGSVVFDFA
ncbi:hypothetical protein [Maridesulfovibrio bastinii]|uniref:hypothetical protein n=1 Tax=Maridesulfovibrio bastinii TaxID=47157 RepID=UPI000557F62B|nr:hypothetical protein [Maridesulfovibrio bastinii]